jgi:two-component system OmpR family response regulator
VVEDDAKLRAILARGLAEHGYAVDTAATGAEAVWQGIEYSCDAVVLDVGLPDIDGFTVCHRLREHGCWAPVLMLTALDGVDHRVRGLDVGADDYLVKPFAFAELLARLRALLRRGAAPRPAQLSVGDLVLDPATRAVCRASRPIALTGKEFELLTYFMRYRDEVLSRTRLVEHVWDSAYDGDLHIVNVYVGYLRDKIDRPFGRTSLQTVRTAGYRLRDDLPDGSQRSPATAADEPLDGGQL